MSKLFMLIGVSGSGKSTWANNNLNKLGMFSEIYSSDEYREKLFGDINDQAHNSEVFSQLHKDMLSALNTSKDICYDATNLVKRDRQKFLLKLDSTVEKIAVIFDIDFNIINEQNHNRNRVVPDDVILRLFSRFNYDNITNEGFNRVILIKR